MNMSNELIIEASLENMGLMMDFLEERLSGCPQKTINQIHIAADEIFSNIARYAYPQSQKPGLALVRITSYKDGISMEFEDSGAAFDPLSAKESDTALPADKREIGGYGIFIVKKIMDSVEYRREGDRNILRVLKKVARE